MNSNKTEHLGYLFALVAAFLWAFLGTLSRVPMSHGVTALEVAFWRCAIGGGLFFAHGLWKKQHRVCASDGLALVLFGLVGVGIFFALFQSSVQYNGAALSAIFLYTAPFWVAVLSRIVFKDKLTAPKICAMLLAMAGVSLLCLSGGGLPGGIQLAGVLCGLFSGLAYSLHFVFGKFYLKRISAMTIYMYCQPVGALVLFPFVEFAPKGPADWLALAALGALCTYAAYCFYCAGLKRLNPTKMAVFCNLEPVLATLLAVVFWQEMFRVAGWIGAALVLAAVFLCMLDKTRADHGQD